MSTQKRALPSTLLGQASLLKRPRSGRKNQTWRWSGRNLVPRSWLTEDDVRRVVREELECAKSDLAEYCRSCIGDALKDVVQQVFSTENAVQKPVSNFGNSAVGVICHTEAMGLANIHSLHLARAIGKSTTKNDARNLRLQLRNKLLLPLFTEKKLEGEGGARISVALVDADTGDVVTSGPEASIKLDVVVLEGDFNKDDGENWAPEEFDSYVVKEREGKRPLLTGNLQVKLKAGVRELGNLMFTDNSSWNRSKSFRIGLKVASRDAYMKHYPPASDDEVWRLESIAKDGSFHKRLVDTGIHKVEEFLRQLYMDPEKLRNILGMTEKKWKALLKHAKTCTPNGKLYVYNENDCGVIFNSVGQVSGHTVDGVYCPSEIFSPQQKVYADGLVKKAYVNWNDVRQYDAEASSSSTVEGNQGITATQLLIQSQSRNPEKATLNQIEPSADTNVQPLGQPYGSTSGFPALSNSGSTAARLPIQPQSLNSPPATWNPISGGSNQMEPSAYTYGSFPGNSGITSAGLPLQVQSLDSQNAMWNQVTSCSNQVTSANTNVELYEQLHRPSSSFVAPNTEDEEYDWDQVLEDSNPVAADQVPFAPGEPFWI